MLLWADLTSVQPTVLDHLSVLLFVSLCECCVVRGRHTYFLPVYIMYKSLMAIKYIIVHVSVCLCWGWDKCYDKITFYDHILAATGPCNVNHCNNRGVCRPNSTSSYGFECLCPPEYTGRLCDIRKSTNIVYTSHYIGS